MVIARLRNGVGGEGELERNGVFYVPASYCIHVFASLTPPTAPAHRPLPSWACVMHVSPARVSASAATRCVAPIRAAWAVHGLQRRVQSPAMVAPAMRLLSRPLPALL